jgi:putative membrane protein
MKRSPLLSLAATLAMAASCQLFAQADAPAGQAGPSPADQTFLRKAAADGATEVALGQQAAQQAQSAPTRELAQHLVSDHTKANRELAELAMRKRVDVPTQPDPEAMSGAKAWSSLQGAAYDRAYVSAMVEDHRKAIALFTEATRSEDPQIRQFAQTTLPVLKQHLSMAMALNKGAETPRSGGAAPEQGMDSR